MLEGSSCYLRKGVIKKTVAFFLLHLLACLHNRYCCQGLGPTHIQGLLWANFVFLLFYFCILTFSFANELFSFFVLIFFVLFLSYFLLVLLFAGTFLLV